MWKTIRPEERFFRVSVDNCFRKTNVTRPGRFFRGVSGKFTASIVNIRLTLTQNFTDEGKHPAKNKIYFGKIPEKHGNYKTDDVFTYTPGTIKYDAKINKNNVISGGIKYKNL